MQTRTFERNGMKFTYRALDDGTYTCKVTAGNTVIVAEHMVVMNREEVAARFKGK